MLGATLRILNEIVGYSLGIGIFKRSLGEFLYANKIGGYWRQYREDQAFLSLSCESQNKYQLSPNSSQAHDSLFLLLPYLLCSK